MHANEHREPAWALVMRAWQTIAQAQRAAGRIEDTALRAVAAQRLARVMAELDALDGEFRLQAERRRYRNAWAALMSSVSASRHIQLSICCKAAA